MKFFTEHNDYFNNVNDIYVLAKQISKTKFKKTINEYVITEITQTFNKFDILNPEINFIIGSCMPSDNILLKYRDRKYFPNKLDKLILDKFQLKYILREKDIRIDLVLFNDIFEDIFDRYFKSLERIQSDFGNEYSNIKFIKNKNLDCLTLYKIIKQHFGRSNVINVWEQKFQNDKLILISINELINRCVHEKSKLNSDKTFIQTYKEVNQFLENCLNIK